MIKVLLPNNNNNIDSYLNTKEAENDFSALNTDELERVLKLSLGDNYGEYEVEFEDRKVGQYIIIENDTEKKWITFSADYTQTEGDGGSTNAYLIQFVPMMIADCCLDETDKEKHMELYLKGTNHNRAKTKGQQGYYRLAKTAGMTILNEFEFDTEIRRNIAFPFESIEEWKKERMEMYSANTSNRSSYIIENEESYVFYGKTFGANGRESIFLLYALAQLAKKENKTIYLYEVLDNGTFAFESSSNEQDKKFKKVLKSLGVVYYQDSTEYIENEENETIDDSNKDARNQAEFMRNMLVKYNCKRDEEGNVVLDRHNKPIIVDDIKRCYLCGCDIQRLIIASHIHRVTDINNMDVPFEEKRKQAVDADNGLWLCASHDKLFEYGLIYFEDDELRISDDLTEEQKRYVEYFTYGINQKEEDSNASFRIDEKDYNENMHSYLEKHRKRTQE